MVKTSKDATEEFATHGYVDDATAAINKRVNKALELQYEAISTQIQEIRAHTNHNAMQTTAAAEAAIGKGEQTARPVLRDFKQELSKALGETIAKFEIDIGQAFIVTRLELVRVGRNIHIEPTIVLR